MIERVKNNPFFGCPMKLWIKKVFGFGLASFLCDFSHEMTIALIPAIVAQFSGAAAAPLVLGIIASIGDAFAAFVRIFAGFLTDRLPRKSRSSCLVMA